MAKRKVSNVAEIMNHYDNSCEKWRAVLAKDKKRTWVCYYINGQGCEKQKVFYDMEEGLEFTKLLDKRIDKGTCGGYSFMEL